MAFKNSLRDRAIGAFCKLYMFNSCDKKDIITYKQRSTKRIVVKYINGASSIWSYKNGGKLERVQ